MNTVEIKRWVYFGKYLTKKNCVPKKWFTSQQASHPSLKCYTSIFIQNSFFLSFPQLTDSLYCISIVLLSYPFFFGLDYLTTRNNFLIVSDVVNFILRNNILLILYALFPTCKLWLTLISTNLRQQHKREETRKER